MPTCNECTGQIDDEDETHLVVVRPMEFKGTVQKVKNYYCSISCLLEHAQGS